MPNSNSIYDVYFGAGEAMGEYEASLRSIEDVWSGIEYSEERTAQRQERAGGRFEDLLSVVELRGELYGGREARKEFEESIPGVQKFIAKESYEKSIKGKAEAIGWEDLGEESRAKLMRSMLLFKLVKVVNYGRSLLEVKNCGRDQCGDLVKGKNLILLVKKMYLLLVRLLSMDINLRWIYLELVY